MTFDREQILHDVMELSDHSFIMKYIIKSPNWYFSNYLDNDEMSAAERQDRLNEIVSNGFQLSFHSAQMVGSAKIGYSLSLSKRLRPFLTASDERGKTSDIDIAVVSTKLFNSLWNSMREARKTKFVSDDVYNRITREVFRGYINSFSLVAYKTLRKEWNEKAGRVTREL